MPYLNHEVDINLIYFSNEKYCTKFNQIHCISFDFKSVQYNICFICSALRSLFLKRESKCIVVLSPKLQVSMKMLNKMGLNTDPTEDDMQVDIGESIKS